MKTHFRLTSGFFLFGRRIKTLAKQPIFITVTILGNSCIFAGTYLLYRFEHLVNPKLESILDAIWWAVATVSTVGYGDVSPVTPIGKVIGIAMMIVGTALFSAYTALFAGALVSAEISDIEQEIETDEKSLQKLIAMLEETTSELRKLKQDQ